MLGAGPAKKPTAAGEQRAHKLESWKEIAAYLSRTVKTVQRWEKSEGLPIHRHPHARRDSVYAFPDELDAWRIARESGLDGEALKTRRRGTIAALTITAVAGVGILTVLLSLRDAPRGPFEQVSLVTLTSRGDSSKVAISPDGRYVVRASGDRGQQGLWLRQIATGSEVPLVPSSHAYFMGLTFSRDGHHVYYVVEEGRSPAGALYAVPVPGGQPRKLKEGLDSPISFSPDGKEYAFVREDRTRGESVLLVARAQDGVERTVASRRLPDYLDYPAWSPDGKVLTCALVRFDAKAASLLAFPVTGGDGRTIGPNQWNFFRQHAWTGTGVGIISNAQSPNSGASSGVYQIWRVPYPEGPVRAITKDLDHYNGVSLTADSRTLVTVSEKLLSTLWVGPGDDSGRIRPATTGTHRFPICSWRADGGVVYDEVVGGTRQIWTVNAAGERRQLTFEGSNHSPSACGDGRTVVFISERAGSGGLWRMNIDGSGQTELVRKAGLTPPNCSPDGRWVAYTSSEARPWPTLRRLNLEVGAQARELDDGYSVHPVVSPDGRRVAVFRAEEERSLQKFPNRVAIFSAEGGGPERISDVPVGLDRVAGLRWTPSGNGVAYVLNRGGVSNIWVHPLKNSEPKQLTAFHGDRIFYFDWRGKENTLLMARGMRTNDVVLIRDLR